ncbi:MAG: hypothetical protein LLF92_06105 [Planctomycetaceae bacterium]|nr:hypothetical protein [Planctomycetaceae bacterium]
MYYLGVDAGGTKTTAILADENANVIQVVKIGSGNVVSLGQTKITELIKNLLAEFSSKCKPENINSSTFAFAGAGRKPEREILEAALKDNRLRNFRIMTDAEIMHYSIFGSGDGILVIAGTGSVCLVRSRNSSGNGKLVQLGGNGFLLGDEGSGYYIGRQAIKKALDDAEIGRQVSLLTEKIIKFYNFQQPKEFVSKVCFSEHPQTDIAAIAQVVCDLAEQNDTQALEIINNASKALTDLAVKAIKHYCPADAEFYNITLGGGILQKDSVVERAFKRQMQNYNFEIVYHSAKMSATAAAVMYSMVQNDLRIDEAMMQKLKNIKI